MNARIRYADENRIKVEFPAMFEARSGDRVKLSGFMMPRDPDLEQRRFLLASNSPSCFRQVPGGPVGAIEVRADEGIEANGEPIVAEGRFETLESSEYGVVFRRYEARLEMR